MRTGGRLRPAFRGAMSSCCRGGWAEADLQFADTSDSDNTTVEKWSLKPRLTSIGSARCGCVQVLRWTTCFFMEPAASRSPELTTRSALSTTSGTLNSSDDYTATGWTAGAGVEWGLSENSSAKIEYLYIDLGSEDGAIPGEGTRFKITPGFQSIRVGIDFQF